LDRRVEIDVGGGVLKEASMPINFLQKPSSFTPSTMVRFTSSTFVSLLALTTSAFAHSTLPEILATRSELTAFVGLVSQFPDLLQSVSSSGGTILAPSNSALTAFIAKLGPEGLKGVSNDTIRALLTYHVLSETLNGEALSARGGGIAETLLNGPESLANLGGKANVVFASAYGSTGLEGSEAGPLRIYSGVGEPATVGAANIGFDGGVVHVLNSCVFRSLHELALELTSIQCSQPATECLNHGPNCRSQHSRLSTLHC
jgi:Fasciclin domain